MWVTRVLNCKSINKIYYLNNIFYIVLIKIEDNIHYITVDLLENGPLLLHILSQYIYTILN